MGNVKGTTKIGNVKVVEVCVGEVQTNCYLVCNEERQEAVLIDPGDEISQLMSLIDWLDLKAILLTHAHFDHVMAVPYIQEEYKAPVYVHEKERVVCEDPDVNLSGSWMRNPIIIHPDVYLTDGEIIDVAGMQFKTIYTPGHTIGSVS
jgi:glyoxylase-like metal-dependent hydrolase (beta-lactamase superfamily II)